MKKIELLIGDHEYELIEQIFEKESDFNPITETDQVIIKALSAIISPKNLCEENVGGEELTTTSYRQVEEPQDKVIDGATAIKNL
jgi:hypothetical protein